MAQNLEAPQAPVDPKVMEAVVQATQLGITMTGLQVQVVGATQFLKTDHRVSALLGLAGERPGTLSLHLSDHAALSLANALLGETKAELDVETLDAIGEVANQIGGALKSLWTGTERDIRSLLPPSVVMGWNYHVHYAKDFTYVAVRFQLLEQPVPPAECEFMVALALRNPTTH